VFVGLAVERIVLPSKGILIKKYFDDLTMTAPPSLDCSDLHYHVIIKQKLLLVDWKRMFNLQMPCPSHKTMNCQMNAHMFPRTNIISNIHEGGPPSMVHGNVHEMQQVQGYCRFDGNNSEILCSLPAYAMIAYPMERPKLQEELRCIY